MRFISVPGSKGTIPSPRIIHRVSHHGLYGLLRPRGIVRACGHSYRSIESMWFRSKDHCSLAEQGLRRTYWRITFRRVRYGFYQGSPVCLVVVDGNQILASYSFVLWIAYMVSWWTDLTSETNSLDHEKRCWAVRSESARPSRQLSSTYPETRSSIPKSAIFQEMSRAT